MFESKTNFENLRIYQLSAELGDLVWEIVYKWDYTARDTIGKQLINSADSVGANIAEGTGRGSIAENRRFAKIARGSLFEVKHWLKRAFQRNLLKPEEIEDFQRIIEELTPKLSAYINPIGKRTINSHPTKLNSQQATNNS
jgi:four helix bundle protein